MFTNVAQPVISNVLSGFNGTIFAYGQTGSGKTFSITGGAERYVDRGIIPRSLSYIFAQLMENADHIFTGRFDLIIPQSIFGPIMDSMTHCNHCFD